MIREETLRFARSKNNHFFDITEKDIISGYHTIPSKKQYWSIRPSLVVPIYLETMSRSRFLEIKKYLHLVNNENLSKSKTAKVDLLYPKLLLNCHQFGIFHKKLSIDESMVPYRGKHPVKQFIRNKPVRFAYKIWFMCGTDVDPYNFKIFECKIWFMCGTDVDPYNFQIYKGKETGPKQEILGSRVVQDMASIIRHEDADKHILYFDNFFTSHQLLDNLGKKNLRATGTVRTNRMMKYPLNILKKDERASLDYRSDGNVLFVQWKDNSVVFIGTNFSSITPLKKVNRWVKGAGKVASDQPNLIADYKTGMGGVDLLAGVM